MQVERRGVEWSLRMVLQCMCIWMQFSWHCVSRHVDAKQVCMSLLLQYGHTAPVNYYYGTNAHMVMTSSDLDSVF